jgi:hypothetical protein
MWRRRVMTASFMSGPYKRHREHVMLEHEKSLIPRTMPIIESSRRLHALQEQENDLKAEMTRLRRRMAETGAQIRTLSHIHDKAKHLGLRNYWRGVERAALGIYAHAVDAALAKYGDQGQLVSGVVREHFPKAVKDDLRKLAHLITEAADAAELHRKASGARK